METRKRDVIKYVGGWAIVVALWLAFGFMVGASIALA